MTDTPDIFAARALVAVEVKGHLEAITAAIAAAQTPTEDFPGGLYPDGLSEVLAQVRMIASHAAPKLAPAPEPEPEE